MKIIKKFYRKTIMLGFVAEGDETAEQLTFLERVKEYDLTVNGASIWVYKRESARFVAQINPFDNTILVCDPEGISLAAEFGAKRFIVGEVRKQLTEVQATETKAIHFTRDRSFPIVLSNWEDEVTSKYRVVNFEELKQEYRTDQQKMYVILASLFERCADFTPSKMQEYIDGGSLEDKYCRFNSGNQHLFLLNDDKNNNVIGTISLTSYGYFYDEVVDYFKLLTKAEGRTVRERSQQLGAEIDEEKKKAIKAEIAAIVEPKRNILLAQLFAAARISYGNIVGRGVPAFIRVASGREAAYVALGCGKENMDIFVIHGAPTPQLKMLDAYMKEWAKEQLKTLQPKPSTVTLLAPKFEQEEKEVVKQQNNFTF